MGAGNSVLDATGEGGGGDLNNNKKSKVDEDDTGEGETELHIAVEPSNPNDLSLYPKENVEDSHRGPFKEIFKFKSPEDFVNCVELVLNRTIQVILDPKYAAFFAEEPKNKTNYTDAEKIIAKMKENTDNMIKNLSTPPYYYTKYTEILSKYVSKKDWRKFNPSTFGLNELLGILVDFRTLNIDHFNSTESTSFIESVSTRIKSAVVTPGAKISGLIGVEENGIYILDRAFHSFIHNKTKLIQLLFDMDYAIPLNNESLKNISSRYYVLNVQIPANQVFLLSNQSTSYLNTGLRVRVYKDETTMTNKENNSPPILKNMLKNSDIWMLSPKMMIWRNHKTKLFTIQHFNKNTSVANSFVADKTIPSGEINYSVLIAIIYSLEGEYKWLDPIPRDQLAKEKEQTAKQEGKLTGGKSTTEIVYGAGSSLFSSVGGAVANKVVSWGDYLFTVALASSISLVASPAAGVAIAGAVRATKSLTIGGTKLVYKLASGALSSGYKLYAKTVDMHPFYKFDQCHSRSEIILNPGFHLLTLLNSIVIYESGITQEDVSLSKNSRSLLSPSSSSSVTFCDIKSIEFTYKLMGLLAEQFHEAHKKDDLNTSFVVNASANTNRDIRCLNLMLDVDFGPNSQRAKDIQEALASLCDTFSGIVPGTKPSLMKIDPKNIVEIVSEATKEEIKRRKAIAKQKDLTDVATSFISSATKFGKQALIDSSAEINKFAENGAFGYHNGKIVTTKIYETDKINDIPKFQVIYSDMKAYETQAKIKTQITSTLMELADDLTPGQAIYVPKYIIGFQGIGSYVCSLVESASGNEKKITVTNCTLSLVTNKMEISKIETKEYESYDYMMYNIDLLHNEYKIMLIIYKYQGLAQVSKPKAQNKEKKKK